MWSKRVLCSSIEAVVVASSVAVSSAAAVPAADEVDETVGGATLLGATARPTEKLVAFLVQLFVFVRLLRVFAGLLVALRSQ